MAFLSFIGSMLFGVPLITAFCARRFGRNFWKWFAVGCVLPLISVFILLLLPEKKNENSSQLN